MKNIQKEIINDLGCNHIYSHGCLESWAYQGVLLLNSVLTVVSEQPGSHEKLGWGIFTDQVIKYISLYCDGIVFLLWGDKAKKKLCLIDQSKHHVFLASHPSPLSVHRGFFGCRHFSKTNKILIRQKKSPINWLF